MTATASFSEGRVSGTTGCNRFGGTYRVEPRSCVVLGATLPAASRGTTAGV